MPAWVDDPSRFQRINSAGRYFGLVPCSDPDYWTWRRHAVWVSGADSEDKAVQIARQLCAGVQAAHAQGILHRDLKPANVMIDGRGNVKITDFGLAGLEETIQDGEIRSGTPAYMAPEQFAGKEVTVKSDIYSLGLVLYELFTGKPAFEASSLTEMRRLHSDATPSSPSSHVEGFDPAVEKAILRCLEKDPRDRPVSALAVSAALPGGDPLAAALASRRDAVSRDGGRRGRRRRTEAARGRDDPGCDPGGAADDCVG